MGGETRDVLRNRVRKGGLSPRGRGNLAEGLLPVVHDGSIPAWAGKPHSGLAVTVGL